jgi:tRNA U54 and U55 pseudouridine synthase Pus10
LVSGDQERTKPSISEKIGIPCIVKELDVIEIKGE